jgi:hypothetical protein
MATSTTALARAAKKLGTSQLGPGGAWHADAPRAVRQSYRALGDERGWRAWQKHLAGRKFVTLDRLADGRGSPLAWSLPDDGLQDSAVRMIKLLAARKIASAKFACRIGSTAETWLSGAVTAVRSASFGLECLAWASAMPRLAACLSERQWWSLLNRLAMIAGEKSAKLDDVLAGQLLRAELPLALAYCFPEVADCRALAKAGRAKLDADLAEMFDGEGLPHCRYLRQLGPLVACWTRCRLLGSRLRGGAWGEAVEAQFPGLVEHALRLCRRDGRPTFAPPDAPRWKRGMLTTALRLAAEPETARLAQLLDRKKPARPRKHEPDASFQGEWAGVAVLRSDWGRKSPQLTVVYDSPQVTCELTLGGRCLWSGVWSLDVRSGGEALLARGHWEQVCWESNKDVDYLELELELSREVTVQRHILLSRQDRFLLLADAVLDIQQASIEYRGTLPTAGRATFVEERETREGALEVDGKALARILPLDLPEWRAARTRGSLRSGPSGLELEQTTDGGCLLAGLWIDLDAGRASKALTWRQLTVGKDRQIVPRDAAVGYRVQVGKSQWLVYRSLSPPAIRTVLGKNLMHEFLVGRFGADGQVETLLEIE